MARAVETDPYMNFRFGVRLDETSPWVGFSEVIVDPDGLGGSGGTVTLKKAVGEEFINFVNSLKGRVNIGIFHITEETGCPDPMTQIDLYGVTGTRVVMGSIVLDAMGGAAEEQVLVTDFAMVYERMEMRSKGAKLKTGPSVHVAKVDHKIYM